MEDSQIMISDKIEYKYDKSNWETFDKGNHLEWVMTNGLGGYAGGSVIGAKNRTHQGYLIMSIHPPVQRYVLLENINEWVSVGTKAYDLEASRHRVNGLSEFKEGQKYLKSVSYKGTICFEYEIKDGNGEAIFRLTKKIGLEREKNSVVIFYEMENLSDEEACIILTPQFNYREHSSLTTKEDLNFETILTGDTLSLVPKANENLRIDFSASEGQYYELAEQFDENYELITEVELETEGLISHYTPYELGIDVFAKTKKSVSIVCSAVINENKSGTELLEEAVDSFVGPNTAKRKIDIIESYYENILKESGYQDKTALRLSLDADHFLVRRESTGMCTVLAGLPWFTDWGRDTMIAFTGLTLCTRRFGLAIEILKSFAKYVHHGMIPNMFPDDGNPPLYNSVDASLWYFYGVHKFLEYSAKDSGLSEAEKEKNRLFIREEIYPVLTRILSAYEKGTDFAIYMEENSLLHAGSDLDQITWMDVRVNDMVVTPRHGHPVEINALWYNALRITESLACEYANEDTDKTAQYSTDATYYGEIADRVKSVFETEFWNEKSKCLYDVTDGSVKDDSIRPNQIYAVSLPYSLLPKDKERSIVDKVMEILYIPYGIRSLDPNHIDYHPHYRGALEKRDLAYHQGTAWGFLMGGFINAYYKTHSNDSDCKEQLLKMITPITEHMEKQNCIGGICEIFEGDFPHAGRGCYTQAWSVGEILRAYTECILNYK